MMNIKRYRRTAGLLLLVLGLLALVGCESDSVAPQDSDPELTQEDAAHQAAVVAMAIAKVGPQVVRVAPLKTVYSHVFDGTDGITGTVEMDFRTGGPDGASASSTAGDWASLVTLGEDGLAFQVDQSATMYLEVGITCSINQTLHTATALAGSGGTFTAGVYVTTFTMDGLTVAATNDYPTSGVLIFTSGPHTLDIEFDGTVNAVISADGSPHWMLNMDTGALTDLG